METTDHIRRPYSAPKLATIGTVEAMTGFQQTTAIGGCGDYAEAPAHIPTDGRPFNS